ncbi:MAG: thiamine phosphate synthase [Caulobacteraceae bacterium]|nr:thiamine phosphate synthase [Caulobacter sp.]
MLRTFGRPDVVQLAPALAALARRRGLVLLVGEDATLAAQVGARGVHLPQRRWRDLARLRLRHPGWWLTLAAHDSAALRRARACGADAAFLSPAFPSASASAGAPLGPCRFAGMARSGGLPIYALGGVTARTAHRLVDTGVAGLAAVEALRT